MSTRDATFMANTSGGTQPSTAYDSRTTAHIDDGAGKAGNMSYGRSGVMAAVLTVAISAVATAQATTGGAASPKPATKAAAPKAAAPKAATPALPAAIDAAFKKAYPAATIKHVSKEKENGREQYEVESVDQGRARDLIYLADGSVVEMEEELAEADVPAAVVAAIKSRYPKATLTKRERLTITKGNVVQYECTISGAKVASVTLTGDGTWVSPKAQ